MADKALTATSRLTVKVALGAQLTGINLLKQESNTHELMSAYMQLHERE